MSPCKPIETEPETASREAEDTTLISRDVKSKVATHNPDDIHRYIVESLPHPLYLIKAEDHTIVFANMAALTAGMSEGTRCYEVINKDCKPQTGSKNQCILKLVKETKQSQVLEYEYQAPDGKTIYTEVHGYPVFNKDGEVSHVIEYLFDNTEHKNREESFDRTISRYKAMINTTPAMTYVKDVESKYVLANEVFCRFANRDINEIMGKTDYDIFPPETAERYHKTDKKIMEENKEMIKREEKISEKDGTHKWYSMTKLPLYDKKGEVSGLVSMTQNITEQHLSREQLVQADKLAAIGTLAAGVAHEINNPIGFINSNLNTMGNYLKKINTFIERASSDDCEERDLLLDILKDFGDAVEESIEGTMRVKKIVADLKSFSRVDHAEKAYANLNDGIETTLNIVWNELKYKCKVEKEYGDIPDLRCIPNQLNQVFMNLLINGAQAIEHDHGLIKIKSWSDDKNIYISIKDNGSGISPENQQKIFEPFFTTKDVGKGTGLGLSLAFDIIKKHKGLIELKSETGAGTDFIITLPLEGISDE